MKKSSFFRGVSMLHGAAAQFLLIPVAEIDRDLTHFFSFSARAVGI